MVNSFIGLVGPDLDQNVLEPLIESKEEVMRETSIKLFLFL